MASNQFTKQTVAGLKNTALALAESSAGIEALATAVEKAGFDYLTITNYDQLQRALEYLERFQAAVIVALRKAKTDRGDFKEAPAKADKPSPVKRAKATNHG